MAHQIVPSPRHTVGKPAAAGPSNLGIEWNAENQLKKVLKNAATIATFAYDPMGRRVEKVAGGTTTTFTYDAEDILREIAGATITYYLHGPGIDEPLAKEISGTATYYHADGLGSVLKVTNAAGSVAHEYRYDAYGRIEAGSTQGGYSFTGREWDSEYELYYFRARYYDPKIGRFISADPIGLLGGMNLYGYVANSPTNWVDPFGLQKFSSAEAAAIAGLQRYNPESIYSNREIGFPICERSEGEFYIGPVARSATSSEVDIPRACDSGGNPVATCHTHGRYGNLGLSGPDFDNADFRGMPSYVADPARNISVYDPATGGYLNIGNTPGQFP